MPTVIRSRLLQSLGLLLLLPLTVPAQTPSGSFAIVKARVFDGETVVPSATVLVKDGKIEAVGADTVVPEGVPTVDGQGKTLLPGLIDAHTHVFGDVLDRALAFGVTTELDMFTDPKQAATWRQEQAEGKANARADIYSAGILATAPGGHGTQYGMPIPTVSKPEDAEAFVDARLAEGSDYIKIVLDDGASHGFKIPTLDRATLEAVIQATHARKKLAVVHIGSQAAALMALEAGADGLVHLFADTAPTPEFASLAAQKKAFVIATLSVIESTTGVASGTSLLKDKALAPYLNVQETTNLQQSFPKRDGSKQNLDHAKAAVKALHDAGVDLLAGTDAPNPGTTHGVSQHRELELLVAAGLQPTEALRAATSAPAQRFGLADRGRIAPGLRADLLLVDGDPTTDILATRQIAGIWKSGQAVTRKEFVAAPAAAAPQNLGDGWISDFETAKIESRFGLGWELSTDQIMGGQSKATMKQVPGGADGSANALEIQGQVLQKSAFPWAGVMFSPGPQPMAEANVSQFQELSFWARGDGGTYQVMLFATRLGYMPAAKRFVAGPEWKEYVFQLKDFSGLDGSDLMGISFNSGTVADGFSFQIDQVRLR